MKAPELKLGFLVLILVGSLTLGRAEPVIDGSSAAAFANSGAEVLQHVDAQGTMGMLDRSTLGIAIGTMVDFAVVKAVEIAGPNASPQQIDQIATREVLSKYDGLTAEQFLVRYAELRREEEVAEQQAQNNKVLKEQTEAEQLESSKSAALQDWLDGKQTQVGLPTAPDLSYELGIDDRCRLSQAANTDKSRYASLSIGVDNGANNVEPTLVAKFTPDYSGVETYLVSNEGKPNIPAAFESLSPAEEEAHSGYEWRRLSEEDFLWFIPKFKEWTKKVMALPPSERPSSIIKAIPNNVDPAEPASSHVWFCYSATQGPGVIVYHHSDRWSSGEEVVSKLLSDEATKLDTVVWYMSNYYRDAQGNHVDLGGMLQWQGIEQLKLVSDLPRLANDVALLAAKNLIVERDNQADAEIRKNREALEKLDLN